MTKSTRLRAKLKFFPIGLSRNTLKSSVYVYIFEEENFRSELEKQCFLSLDEVINF